ncbi:MAG: hypothetical protein R3C61_28990 [Bacteroidia bacterium]
MQSHYQRLIRFLKTGVSRRNFCTTSCATTGPLRQGHQTLILDGTSWKFGKTEIHYLVLAVQVAA